MPDRQNAALPQKAETRQRAIDRLHELERMGAIDLVQTDASAAPQIEDIGRRIQRLSDHVSTLERALADGCSDQAAALAEISAYRTELAALCEVLCAPDV